VAIKDILDAQIENNVIRNLIVLPFITTTRSLDFDNLLNKWLAMIEKQLAPFA